MPSRAALVAGFLVLPLPGCGKKGDPLPPLRRTPQPVASLRLAQRGDRLELSLVAPRAATDGARLPVHDVEILRSDGAGDFLEVARTRKVKAAPGETLTEVEPLPAPGITVRVAARALLGGRPSQMTEVVSLTVQAPPASPADLGARSSPAGVGLGWTAREGAAFRVYRRGRGGAYGRALGEAGLPAYEDRTAVAGESWCYVVRTVVSSDPLVESADSEEACLSVEDVAPPASPAGVTALAREGGIDLSWSPSPEADLASYRVYRGLRGGAPQRLVELPRGEASFRDATAQPGSVYVYTVTAVDRAGNESAPSAPFEGSLP